MKERKNGRRKGRKKGVCDVMMLLVVELRAKEALIISMICSQSNLRSEMMQIQCDTEMFFSIFTSM